MRLAVLVSPGAGGGRGGRLGTAVLRSLAERGHDVQDVTGPTAEQSAARAAEAVRTGAQVLVVVGGDGALQLAVGAVAGTGTALAVVAAGSGNDAARALGLPPLSEARSLDRLHTALARWGSAGPPTPGADPDPDPVRGLAVDLLRVSATPLPATPLPATLTSATPLPAAPAGGPRWVVGVLAAGFDAAVNARANRWAEDWRTRSAGHRLLSRLSLPGRARYTAAVLRELPAWRPRRYRLVLDGRPLEGPAVLVAVAGTTSYGGGLRIAPGARTDDGLADVVVVGRLGRLGLLAMLPTVFGGWHVHHRAVTVHRAAVLEVALADASPPGAGPVVHGDGEPLGMLPVRVEVVPGALRLLV